jgi:membrane protease subunit (stomatin/prohibitin family)
MALLGREFIAVPDDHKGSIVYKWPDVSIRRFTRAIVNADEVALFVNTGKVVQTMGPGRHQIDADELPGLGILLDAATGGNAYRAELYFVGSREYTDNSFGGRVDDVQDPATGLIVTLRVFGDYALRVTDPVALITNLLGSVDVTENDRVTGWVSDQLLKVMRKDVTTQIVRNGWPILGLSAYTTDIENAVIVGTNEQLKSYGVALTRMGNFDINLAPEDADQLKKLAKDTSYSRLAGSFNQYAAGEMALGAGAGMAQGGGAVQGAFLGLGMGMGGQGAGQGYPPVAPPPQGFAGGTPGGYLGPPPGGGAPAIGAAQPGAAITCASCGTQNPQGARFCVNCGQPPTPPSLHCTQCGTQMAAGSRFCPSCGTPTAAAAPPQQAAPQQAPPQQAAPQQAAPQQAAPQQAAPQQAPPQQSAPPQAQPPQVGPPPAADGYPQPEQYQQPPQGGQYPQAPPSQ